MTYRANDNWFFTREKNAGVKVTAKEPTTGNVVAEITFTPAQWNGITVAMNLDPGKPGEDSTSKTAEPDKNTQAKEAQIPKAEHPKNKENK